MITHNPMKTSYPKIFHLRAISALERNFSAKANSRKPKTTFTLLIQLPDLGNELSHAGNAANNPNGIANAMENPNITKKGPIVDDAD